MSDVLRSHNFKFQKKYGQNFLTDVKIPRRISMECTDFVFEDENEPETKAESLILEIGPGAGILTKELAKRFERVVAVEIDESLRGVLEESLSGYDNAEVVFGDIMDKNLHELLDERRMKNGVKMPVSVCANLPYYITTPIIMKLLEEYEDFSYITVMVQKEVATRLCASEKDADYGAITAQINLYGTVKRLFTVPSGCFFPRPKVDSAVIRIKRHNPSLYTSEQMSGASKLIKSAFLTRRKTLANSLSQSGFDFTRETYAKVALELFGDEAIRGEKLSCTDFVKLYDALSELGKADKA